MCFADGLFRRFSSLIFQVSLAFVPGTLDFSCWHVSGLLSACSMARGQEETSTSQAGCRRGLSGICLLQVASSILYPWRS